MPQNAAACPRGRLLREAIDCTSTYYAIQRRIIQHRYELDDAHWVPAPRVFRMRSLTLIAFACSACTAHALFGLFRKRVTPVPPRGVAAFAPTEKPIDAVTFLPESTVERAGAGNPAHEFA